MSGLCLVGMNRSTLRHHPYTDYLLIKQAIAIQIYYRRKINPSYLPEQDSLNWTIVPIETFMKYRWHPIGDARTMSEIKDKRYPSHPIWNEINTTTLYFLNLAFSSRFPIKI